ncbi:hypothetical protein [Nitrospira sp. M1]
MSKTTEWVPTRSNQESEEDLESEVLLSDQDDSTIKVGQRINRPTCLFVILVPLLLLGVPLGYQAGMLETLGYESKSIKGSGFTSTQSGMSLGVKTMYFLKGQTVFVDYDANVKAGSLWIKFYNVTSMLDADAWDRHKVESTGKGTASFAVEKSGWYRLAWDGTVLGQSPAGSGYDIDYTLTWGMR